MKKSETVEFEKQVIEQDNAKPKTDFPDSAAAANAITEAEQEQVRIDAEEAKRLAEQAAIVNGD